MSLVAFGRSSRPGYQWLGREDLTVVGKRPVGAGGLADVWVGRVGDAQRFYREALACACLSDRRVLSFRGVRSSRECPFALVFGFVEHLDLGEYPRND